MDELYDHGAETAGSHDTSSEADQDLRPVDDAGQEHWGEYAEPLTRGEYADEMRQGPAIEENDHSGDGEHSDEHNYQQADADEDQESEELPEPRTRQEVADETDHSEPAGSDHNQASGTDLDNMIAEQDQLPEPRTRQEVADETRSGTGPLTRGDSSTETATRPEQAPDTTAEHQEPGQHEPYGQDRNDNPHSNVTVVHADAADRTLGDDTPTGIGLKPTGEQILHMERDDTPEDRKDNYFRELFERADDIRDVSEHTTETIENFRHHDDGSVVTSTAHGGHTVHDRPSDGTQVQEFVGSIALMSVAAVVGIRHWWKNRGSINND